VAPIGVVNTPAPIYLAELGDAKLRVTPLAIVAVPASKDLQLWMFMVDQQTPISLGVLPATGGIFSLPQIPTEGARFVISLEQHGGVMPGKITGEVLYGGTLARR
jgi:anti-sigma-K factor RskA